MNGRGEIMKMALGQIEIVWEDKKRNMEKLEKFVEKAKTLEADIVLFPEMSLTGFSMNIEKVASNDAPKWLMQISKKYEIYIGAGYVEMKNGKGLNKYVIVSPDDIVCLYTKIHLFSPGGEDKYYIPGKEIVTCSIMDVNITPFICYDLRFPYIFQAASKSTDVFVIPANWPEKRREHWLTLLKARAIENQCYVLGINRVGKDPKTSYSGDTTAFGPWGEEFGRLSFTEGLLIVDVDPIKVKEVREKFPVLRDRRINLWYK